MEFHLNPCGRIKFLQSKPSKATLFNKSIELVRRFFHHPLTNPSKRVLEQGAFLWNQVPEIGLLTFQLLPINNLHRQPIKTQIKEAFPSIELRNHNKSVNKDAESDHELLIVRTLIEEAFSTK
jgi:hypothetical protein